MDNTELHYITYDSEEIWKEMMVNYVEAGGDIVYPGDEKEILLRGVLANVVQILAGVDNALRMQTLRYAAGDYLDALGENRGCERIKAKPAKATVMISTNPTGGSATLEAGTKMTADGVVFYQLDEDLELSGFKQSLTANISAVEAGTEGNGLISGTEMVLTITSPNVSRIVCTEAATGGAIKEDDASYRERIRTYGLASVTTGPSSQYETVVKAYSANVLDAKAINTGEGQVGVYVILKDETGKHTLLKNILETLNDKDTRPLTDKISVFEATDIPYVLNVEITSDRSSATAEAIAAAVEEYQEWQDNTVGRAFNPDRLMALLYQAGATRVVWGSGSNINSKDVTYTEIKESERCKGTINVTNKTS
ncbi:MAG: baseplate J/gp47 family protein [Eubacteriales bacterium]|nr:baseplate J/gp47 family protein [Eubacteriales bacterium]